MYTIAAGNTNEEFAIGPSSGVIRVTKSLTSRSYTLTVNAADGSGDLEDSAEAVVTVTTSYITGWTSPGERAGADVHIAVSQAIAENSKAAGEEIFTAEATPQADGSITSYTLIYSNDSVGVIGQNGGIVNVAAGKNFDFETYPSYVFIIMYEQLFFSCVMWLLPSLTYNGSEKVFFNKCNNTTNVLVHY